MFTVVVHGESVMESIAGLRLKEVDGTVECMINACTCFNYPCSGRALF